MALLRSLVVLLATLLPAKAMAEAELLMAEEAGCPYCARWDAEIAAIYPKTPEGKTAPLTRYDLREGTPEGITLSRRVNFTPTFILLRDGSEVGRIEGYPGEDFFWALLAEIFRDANIPTGDGNTKS